MHFDDYKDKLFANQPKNKHIDLEYVKKLADNEMNERNFSSKEMKEVISTLRECEILRDMLGQANKMSRAKLGPFLDSGFVHHERQKQDDKYVVDKYTQRKR